MKDKKRILELLPIVLVLGFIPLLVHMHTYNCNLSQFDWFPNGSESQSDFFLYYKMVAIIIVGVLMAVLLLYKYATDKKSFQWNHAWYFLLAYGFLALLSALFSQYRYFAFHGSYEVFESIWVVLCYVLFCFYAYQHIRLYGRSVFTVLTCAGFYHYLCSLLHTAIAVCGQTTYGTVANCIGGGKLFNLSVWRVY